MTEALAQQLLAVEQETDAVSAALAAQAGQDVGADWVSVRLVDFAARMVMCMRHALLSSGRGAGMLSQEVVLA